MVPDPLQHQSLLQCHCRHPLVSPSQVNPQVGPLAALITERRIRKQTSHLRITEKQTGNYLIEKRVLLHKPGEDNICRYSKIYPHRLEETFGEIQEDIE